MTVAFPVLVMAASATGVTLVINGELVLLVEMRSVVLEVTVAMLEMLPFAGGLTVSVTLVTAPMARVPKVQLTTPALLVPPLLAETNTTFVGNTSLATTLVAFAGPKFVTEIV